MQATKTCSKCKAKKPASEFYESDNGLYLYARCIICEREHRRSHYDPAKQKSYTDRYLSKSGKKIRTRWRLSKSGKESIKISKRKAYTSIQGGLGCRMRRSVLHSLRKNKAGRHWETLVGYTVHDLKRHLESRFKNGMSWENFGKWHIDHIVAQARFNFKKPEDKEFRRCWALSNLQPLWAKDNFSKQDRTIKEWNQLAIL